MGFTKESVREERKAWDPTTGPALAAGRKLVTRYNCQGCHLIEGKGHAIKTSMKDDTNLPPNLASQGARTQADWLFSFLHDPSQVRMRPWLTVRMPTFEFSDQQVNTVIGYFQGLNQTTPFESDPAPADRRSVAVGGEVFAMLQCARCHPAGAEALKSLGGGTARSRSFAAAGQGPAAPRLGAGLDQGSAEVDPGHQDADQLPDVARRQDHVAAAERDRHADLRRNQEAYASALLVGGGARRVPGGCRPRLDGSA